MKMLVVSNCATVPYARIFACLLPRAHVSSWHVSRLDTDPPDFKSYDVVLVLSDYAQRVSAEASKNALIIEIPSFHFSGYHPDATYAVSAENTRLQIKSPAGAYHSLIAMAAFKCGLDVGSTLSLYHGGTYNTLGYFDEYEKSKASLIEVHKAASLDISPLFRRWSRRGCFMHSFNHPRNYCFEDIAKLICNRNFGGHVDWPYELQDILVQNMIFPCYPEIAERRGTIGSHTFKVSEKFQLLSLKEFISSSFDLYRSLGADNIMVSIPFRTKFNAALDLCRGGNLV